MTDDFTLEKCQQCSLLSVAELPNMRLTTTPNYSVQYIDRYNCIIAVSMENENSAEWTGGGRQSMQREGKNVIMGRG